MLIFLLFVPWICLFTIKIEAKTSSSSSDRSRRDSISYSYSEDGQNYFTPLTIPTYQYESPLYSLGIDTFLPIPSSEGFDQQYHHSAKANIAPVAYTNSVEKPVEEQSDPVPQTPRITAVIPLQPPPAVPVNAAAANIPANTGAVFLGSGALGVVNLGNGAFALGSGGIGYSNMRQQPRPSGQSPLYPPLAATPNILPAATPSRQPPIQIPHHHANFGGQLTPSAPGKYQFMMQPLYNKPIIAQNQNQIGSNGYERLPSTAVRFGSPILIPRPVKTRMNYATPSQVNLPSAVEYFNQPPQPGPGFGTPIPRLPPNAVQYV